MAVETPKQVQIHRADIYRNTLVQELILGPHRPSNRPTRRSFGKAPHEASLKTLQRSCQAVRDSEL